MLEAITNSLSLESIRLSKWKSPIITVPPFDWRLKSIKSKSFSVPIVLASKIILLAPPNWG